MHCPKTKFSKTRKLSVFTTPQRKSSLNIVNSTPVNNLIADIKSREPVQSPIEKTVNTAISTRSQKKCISGLDASIIESSSSSTPKSTAKCSFKSTGVDCSMRISNGKLPSNSEKEKEKLTSCLLKEKALRCSKSNLSPMTKRQHSEMNKLSCSFNNPIGLTNSVMISKTIISKRLTRSFTKLNSDSETTINVSQIHDTSADVSNNKIIDTVKKDLSFLKTKKSFNDVENNSLAKPNSTKRLTSGKSNDKVASATKQTLSKTKSNIHSRANEKVNSKIVSTNSNKPLNCSKNDVSEQNENGLSSESCDSLSKRNSDNFYSQSISKPSFIRRKLYSQMSDFTDNDSVKTIDTSFLEQNNVKNVYGTKIKTINNLKVQSGNDNGDSNKLINDETKRKSTNTLRNYCLRKNQKDSKVNSDITMENAKENTCQFIAGLLKNIDPKIVPCVATNGIGSGSMNASNDGADTIKETDENFDIFAKDAKNSGKAVTRKRKYVKKQTPKIKQKKRKEEKLNQVRLKPKINKIAGKTIEYKESKLLRCISSSDSDMSATEISINTTDNDKKKKSSKRVSKAPLRHSKLAAVKKIEKYTNEINLEKVQCSTGCDYSSEDNSDESPFRMFGNENYSEMYSTEEYDSPARVLKNNNLNLQSRISHSKLPSSISAKTVSNVPVKNYMTDQRFPAHNRYVSPHDNYPTKSSSQFSFKTQPYKKIAHALTLDRKAVEQETVLHKAFTSGKYAVYPKLNSTLLREDAISTNANILMENFQRDEVLGYKNNFLMCDRNQSPSSKCNKDKFNKIRSVQKLDRNFKKSAMQDNNLSFNKRSNMVIDNFKPSQNLIGLNKVTYHSTEYEEFKLPGDIFKSSRSDRLDNYNDNRFERRTHMEHNKYGNMQNDWKSRNHEPVRFKDGKLVTSGKFSEINTCMMSKVRNGTFMELKQKKEFQNVTLNFNQKNKQPVTNLFGSTFTESFSQMNKINPHADYSYMSGKQNDISLFKKSFMGLAKDTRSLVHSQTIYPRALKPHFSSATASYDSSQYKDHKETSFMGSYTSTLKKYNNQDCLKMNVFEARDARKNHFENSLLFDKYNAKKCVLNKNENWNESLMTMQNQSKYIKYKSLPGIGFPNASNQTYRDSTASQSQTFKPNDKVNEPFVDGIDVNSMFKMPQKPSKKRLITDLDEESDRGCFKIPRLNESVSSFSTSNATLAVLKGKETSYRDASYVISGTSRLKNCVFQQKSSLAGPISNSTFLGTTLKASKPCEGIGFPPDILALKKYNHKSIHSNQSLSQNNATHVFEKPQFLVDTSKKYTLDRSSINGDIVMENLNMFQTSHISDTFSNANVVRKELVANKHNSNQLMSQKSDASFIVRKNNILSIKSGLTSSKVLSMCHLKPETAQSEESAQPSKSLPIKSQSVKCLTPPPQTNENSSALSQSVDLSPWRFAVLK